MAYIWLCYWFLSSLPDYNRSAVFIKSLLFLSLAGILCFLFSQTVRSQTTLNDSVYNFVPKMPEYPGGQRR